MSLVLTWFAAARASGPRNSHFTSAETSQTPTSSRTARYSAGQSPKPWCQNQPPSSLKVPPIAAMVSCRAVLDDSGIAAGPLALVAVVAEGGWRDASSAAELPRRERRAGTIG